MNYAEDRLDRRARYHQEGVKAQGTTKTKLSSNSLVLSDLKRAHHLLQRLEQHDNVPTLREESSNNAVDNDSSPSTTSTTGSSSSNNGNKLKSMKEAHELAGRTLRDCGFCRHASFHYGMAWMCDVEDASCAGDYAQMAEFCGFPEIGVLSLFYYLNGGNLKMSNGQTSTPLATSTMGNSRATASSMSFVEEILMNKQTQSEGNHNVHYSDINHHCGCGMDLCGSSQCFIPVDIIHRSTTTKDILGALASLDAFILTRKDDISERITASDILGRTMKNIPNSTLSKPSEGSLEGISHLLRFWESPSYGKAEDKNQKCSNKRHLSPLLQILLLKLLYCTPSSSSSLTSETSKNHTSSFLYLACEAIRHFSITMPTISSSKLSRQMARDYKSHWAYYVFIQAIVLGQRVKKHRRNSIIPYHLPVWDIVHGIDGRKFGGKCSASEASSNIVDKNNSDIDGSRTSNERGIIRLNSLLDLLSFLSRGQERPMSVTNDVVIQPTNTQYPPIFALGDSHVLSLGWQTLQIPLMPSSTTKNRSISKDVQSFHSYRTIIPYPVTGLKAWHVRGDTKFFTHTNLRSNLKRIPLLSPSSSTTHTIILSAGEIDCREGIGGKRLEGYNHKILSSISDTNAAATAVAATTDTNFFNEEIAIQETIHHYLSSLNSLAIEFNLQILLMPVAPHAYRSEKNGRAKGRAVRRERMLIWNNALRDMLPSSLLKRSSGYQNEDETNENGHDISLVETSKLTKLEHASSAGSKIQKQRIFLLDYEESLRSKDETSPVGFVLNKVYNADFTHMNSAFLPLLEKAICECGCDLTVL